MLNKILISTYKQVLRDDKENKFIVIDCLSRLYLSQLYNESLRRNNFPTAAIFYKVLFLNGPSFFWSERLATTTNVSKLSFFMGQIKTRQGPFTPFSSAPCQCNSLGKCLAAKKEHTIHFKGVTSPTMFWYDNVITHETFLVIANTENSCSCSVYIVYILTNKDKNLQNNGK